MKGKIDVTCAVIIRNNKVLIVRKGPSVKMSGLYEFPGGKIEKGESAEDCIVREVREELGIVVKVIDRLLPSVYDYHDLSVNLIPFLCTYHEGIINLTEHDLYHFVDPDNLGEYEWCAADVAIWQQVQKLDLTRWS